MTMMAFGGDGPLWPSPYQANLAPAFANLTPLTAATHLVAWVGMIDQPGMTGTKDIDRVEQISFGAVTKAGGSNGLLSLQGVDAAAGPPFRPDGVIGQSVQIANADTGFVSSSNYTSGLFSTTRAVSPGEMIALVAGYDGARLGSDSLTLRAPFQTTNNTYWGAEKTAGILRFDGTNWALADQSNNAILRFTDGTFCSLSGIHIPFASVSTYTYNINTAARDEVAAVITMPFDCEIDALYCAITAASTADFDLVLYDAAGTLLASSSCDANQATTASARHILKPIAKVALTKNTPYYVAIKPTTTTSISVYSVSAAQAAHMACWPGGPQGFDSDRVDAGPWTTVSTTERVLAGVRIHAIDIPTGGGGAGISYIPNLEGI